MNKLSPQESFGSECLGMGQYVSSAGSYQQKGVQSDGITIMSIIPSCSGTAWQQVCPFLLRGGDDLSLSSRKLIYFPGSSLLCRQLSIVNFATYYSENRAVMCKVL